MKKWLSLMTAAGLLLYPFAAVALDYGSQPAQTQQAPPVAQTLVREGDFAIKLAAELGLGNPTDEATAEDVLATAGVLPSNGWISDYPMTPEIVGQLHESITMAAGEGKLPKTAEEATRGLYTLASEMNLPTPAGSATTPADAQKAPADSTSPTVINNYYYEQGPPIVTYYPPPADYLYLYAWVPYPTFWFGFWFPGFYICHNFTTVVVTNPVFVDNGVVVHRRGVVSNRFIDPVTRRVAVVDRVMRTTGGNVRTQTVLRTESGRTFNSTMELRRDTLSRTDAVQRGTFATGSARNEGFRNPESRRSAGNLFSRSVEGANMRRERGDVGMVRGNSGNSRSFGTPNVPERSFRPPLKRGDTQSVRPQSTQRAPERSFSGSGAGGPSGNPFISPRTQQRSIQPPVTRGSSGSSGRFTRPAERSFSGVARGNGSQSFLPSVPAQSFSNMQGREGGGGFSRSPSSNRGRGR